MKFHRKSAELWKKSLKNIKCVCVCVCVSVITINRTLRSGKDIFETLIVFTFAANRTHNFLHEIQSGMNKRQVYPSNWSKLLWDLILYFSHINVFWSVSIQFLKFLSLGAPGRLSRLSIRLLISTQLMTSWFLCWPCRACLGFFLSLSLCQYPTCALSLSQNKWIHLKIS